MKALFAKLKTSWQNWTGDRELELAIRKALKREGYGVHAAKIQQVHLAAIERPGWVQVYRFLVDTTHQLSDHQPDRQGEAVHLFGVAFNDGRKESTDVFLTTNASEQTVLLDRLSEGMLRRR